MSLNAQRAVSRGPAWRQLRPGRGANPPNSAIGRLAESVRQLPCMVLEMTQIEHLVFQFGHLVP